MDGPPVPPEGGAWGALCSAAEKLDALAARCTQPAGAERLTEEARAVREYAHWSDSEDYREYQIRQIFMGLR